VSNLARVVVKLMELDVEFSKNDISKEEQKKIFKDE